MPPREIMTMAQFRAVQASEHQEQAALFEWAAWHTERVPALRLMYAVPNGGKRDKATAARLKAEGVKAGVPDICLPIARNGYHGFYIELKVGTNKPTKEQLQWLDALRLEGYMVDVSYGWIEAAHKIIRYLGLYPEDYGV